MEKIDRNFEAFCQTVADNIKDYLPPEYADSVVELRSEIKNHDVPLMGITVRKENSSFSPVLYLNGFFDPASEQGLDVALGRIADAYMHAVENVPMREEFSISWITDYAKARERIVCHLCSMEQNQAYLEGKVYRQMDDFAVTYHVLVSEDAGATYSAPVTEDLLQAYGIGKEELHDQAMENTMRLCPPTISSMAEVMASLGAQTDSVPPIYVLTNKQMVHGAVGILFPEVMDMVAQKLGNECYVIPSSVHELLLLPKSFSQDYRFIDEMIREVNKTAVSPEEVLGEHVYELHANERRLVRCDRAEQERIEQEQKVQERQVQKPAHKPKGPRL